jgi:hypothetical protein
MTQHRRRGLRWWNIWLPLLLLLFGGLLVLEPQGPLSPGGHPIAQVVLALLIYGAMTIWLWCTLVNRVFERKQAHERRRAARQQRRERVAGDDEPGEEAWPPRHSNGHYTDMQRRR